MELSLDIVVRAMNIIRLPNNLGKRNQVLNIKEDTIAQSLEKLGGRSQSSSKYGGSFILYIEWLLMFIALVCSMAIKSRACVFACFRFRVGVNIGAA